MRKKLLESAALIFAEKGISASVVQDVVEVAQVSQGTFYNYFRTNDELFEALAAELSDESIQMIEPVIGDIQDPLLRIGTGIRCYLHLMRSCRMVAQFIAMAGLRHVSWDGPFNCLLPLDLEAAQRQGRIDAIHVDVAMDLIGGAGLKAIHRIAAGATTDAYPEQVATMILQSLGIDATEAARRVAGPVPFLAVRPDSLFARVEARGHARGVLTREAGSGR
jgi:AcrR family transcriptional regulator